MGMSAYFAYKEHDYYKGIYKFCQENLENLSEIVGDSQSHVVNITESGRACVDLAGVRVYQKMLIEDIVQRKR